jgi:hypothetical protein
MQMHRFSSFVLVLLSSAFLAASSGNSQEVEKLDFPPRKLPPASPGNDCCESARQKIIVEVPPPEIVIQRAVASCAPEPKGLLQRCNYCKYHQWTHVSGHGCPAPVSGVPMVYAPQSFVPQSFVPQSFVPQSFVPQSFAAQSFVPQSFVPQSFAAQSFVPQSFVPQSFVPQSFVPQSFVPQSFVPQSFVPQSFVPQSGTADDKLDIRTAVKNLSENMETASKLLKAQAQILKIHDDRISNLEATLKGCESLLDAARNQKFEVKDGFLKVKDK